ADLTPVKNSLFLGGCPMPSITPVPDKLIISMDFAIANNPRTGRHEPSPFHRLDRDVSPRKQTNHKEHEKQEKQHLGDARCTSRDARKAKHRSNESDDKKSNRPVKHANHLPSNY